MNKDAQLFVSFCLCFIVALASGILVELFFIGLGTLVFGALFGFLFFDPVVTWWRRTYRVGDNQ